MPAPLYVPALPARRSAFQAHAGLAPHVRAAVAPLWTVPPRVPGPDDPDPTALGRHLCRALRGAADAQRGLPAWLDASHAERQSPGTLGEFTHALADTPLRPVTGVGRTVRQQLASAEAALAGGDGLGIRVSLPALPDERLRDAVGALLERTASAGPPLDLLLDLGAVEDEHLPAEKWALRALDLLGPLHPWRTLAVLAGSFPRSVPEGYGAPLAEAERLDWDLWHMLVDGPERPGFPLTYGDYGADHPAALDRPAEAGGGSPWGVLRYTTDRTFLLGRVPTRGDGRAEAIRAAAREIVEAEDFRGSLFGEGERWLVACAGGRGGEGAGNPAVWRRVAHLQHLTKTVRDLRRRL
ncbi:hypothetical protein AB0G79_18570 [Streptomyces sp. NPDC020807]|uniref:beta family protein n=1 Tax=Streptomyces sp. NPDC020807 TaxID=3155119 RepID=UPI0033ED2CC3